MTNAAPIGSAGITARLRAALYLRASSKKRAAHGDDFQQRPEIQEERFRRLCEQRGWEVVAVHCDRATGTKESRPELNRLMQDARLGMFNVVAVAAFDRFARSVKHLVTALDEFRHLNIDFVSLRESIDTRSPMGKAMFTVIRAMAELESALISERTAAAMEYTRLHGSRSGRSIGLQRRVFDRSKAQEMRQAGRSYRQIAHELGISVGTLHAGVKEYAPCSEKGESYEAIMRLTIHPPEAAPIDTEKVPLSNARQAKSANPVIKHSGGRPRKEIDADKLKRLLEEGRSIRRVARDLECGYGAVYRAAQRLGHGPGDPKVIQNCDLGHL